MVLPGWSPGCVCPPTLCPVVRLPFGPWCKALSFRLNWVRQEVGRSVIRLWGQTKRRRLERSEGTTKVLGLEERIPESGEGVPVTGDGVVQGRGPEGRTVPERGEGPSGSTSGLH